MTGSWICCILCSCSKEGWPGGIWRSTDRWEYDKHWLVKIHISIFVGLFVWKLKNNKKLSASCVLLLDDPEMIRAARRDSTCSFYQPPPPTDIEKMRNNVIKEQKVFALIREILGRKTTLLLDNKRCHRFKFVLLISHICFCCSLSGFHVDVTSGGIWSEGPQRFLSDSAHPTELQQRHLRQYECSGRVQVGKQHSAEQPFRETSRSARN